MRGPIYSMMNAPFSISSVANRPSPVSERPTRKGPSEALACMGGKTLQLIRTRGENSQRSGADQVRMRHREYLRQSDRAGWPEIDTFVPDLGGDISLTISSRKATDAQTCCCTRPRPLLPSHGPKL